MRIVLGVATAALVSSFLSQQMGLSPDGVAIYLGFLLGLTVVLMAFEVPGLLIHRTRTGENGRLKVLPWVLVIAAVFVLISRLANLQPGYLYGIVLGVIFLQAVGRADEGREQAAGMMGTLLLAIGAWFVLTAVRQGTIQLGSFGDLVLATAAAAVLVSGLEAVAFGLMPFTFMPGRAVYRWHRWVWALLSFAAILAFIHILIGPTSGYLSDLDLGAWLAALAVFGAFAAFSVGFWAWFRFRPSPATE
jgi:hypothetical protein